MSHTTLHHRQGHGSRMPNLRTALLATIISLLSSVPAAAQYTPKITQIDTKSFPTIRVYVTVADAQGNPIPDNHPIALLLYEDGKLVTQQVLSEGWSVSSVLVLDLSGSMNKDKLQKAKEAAIRYVDIASPQHQIAVVSFSDTARVIGRFTDSRDVLRSRIRSLTTSGRTALQDGIGAALDLLQDRSGRREIVALTDGLENTSKDYPGETGHARLIRRAQAEQSAVSIIGLGEDVNEAYLKSYEQTNGTYLFSPDASRLRSAFERAITLVEKERVLEYVTANQDLVGTSPQLSVTLAVDGNNSTEETLYTKHGLIPHVRGDHLPYLVLLLLLLYLPGLASVIGFIVSVSMFRSKHMERLQSGSACIGKDDPNWPRGEKPFEAGDLVIRCPVCARPYFITSWRYLKCHCPLGGEGSYCYQKVLPKWVRNTLDFLTEKRKDAKRGRAYLCHCAGDKEGW